MPEGFRIILQAELGLDLWNFPGKEVEACLRPSARIFVHGRPLDPALLAEWLAGAGLPDLDEIDGLVRATRNHALFMAWAAETGNTKAKLPHHPYNLEAIPDYFKPVIMAIQSLAQRDRKLSAAEVTRILSEGKGEWSNRASRGLLKGTLKPRFSHVVRLCDRLGWFPPGLLQKFVSGKPKATKMRSLLKAVVLSPNDLFLPDPSGVKHWAPVDYLHGKLLEDEDFTLTKSWVKRWFWGSGAPDEDVSRKIERILNVPDMMLSGKKLIRQPRIVHGDQKDRVQAALPKPKVKAKAAPGRSIRPAGEQARQSDNLSDKPANPILKDTHPVAIALLKIAGIRRRSMELEWFSAEASCSLKKRTGLPWRPEMIEDWVTGRHPVSGLELMMLSNLSKTSPGNLADGRLDTIPEFDRRLIPEAVSSMQSRYSSLVLMKQWMRKLKLDAPHIMHDKHQHIRLRLALTARGSIPNPRHFSSKLYDVIRYLIGYLVEPDDYWIYGEDVIPEAAARRLSEVCDVDPGWISGGRLESAFYRHAFPQAAQTKQDCPA